MHRRIAGSRLVIIEDASHLCFAEQPEEFNKVINSFMTQRTGRVPQRRLPAVGTSVAHRIAGSRP